MAMATEEINDIESSVFKVTKNCGNTGKNLVIYSKLDKTKKCLDIKILDETDESAYSAQLTDEKLKPFYTAFDISSEEYWKDLREPMMGSTNHFEFWLHKTEFVLKQKTDTTILGVDIFKIHLDTISADELKTELVTVSCDIISQYKSKHKELLKITIDLRDAVHGYQELLKEKLNEKDESQDLILKRCVQLINEKKKKIVELEKKLEGVVKRKKAKHDESIEKEDDDAYEMETDVEDTDSHNSSEETEAESSNKLKHVIPEDKLSAIDAELKEALEL